MEGFCRGCLMRYDDPTELLPYTEKNRRLFIYSTGIQVRQNEVDTFQLCKDCHVNMKLSCKFKKQCRISDKKFKHYLSLKEVGDAFNLATFLKSNNESLGFPLLSGSSTPRNQGAASEQEKDDDNESTCTSIRNFMTDILQGEEMPDAEAHIIKEVIEETDLLDDTLDSQWLQDDISRDTDFKDLSFSPFSNPRSINLDNCYTPNKHIEENIINYDNISDQNKKNTNYQDKIDVPNTDTTHVESLQTLQTVADAEKDNNNEHDILYDEITDQNVNYVTQTENDAENNNDNEHDILYDEITDQNVNYVTQNENDIAVMNTDYDNIRNETYYVAKALQKQNEQHHTNHVQNQDQLAVKYLLESNKENGFVTSDNNDKNNSFSSGTKNININQVNGGMIEFSLTWQDSEAKENTTKMIVLNQTKDNQNSELSTFKDHSDLNKKLNHVELSQGEIEINLKVTHGEQCDNDDNQNEKDISEGMKTGSDKDFILDDLLLLPKDYLKAPGASTPMINDIIFGEKLDINDGDIDKDNIQKSGKDKNGIDILDEMLNQGVKEFSIHTQESQAAIVYDLKQLYCKSCDKKFRILKRLKTHLVGYHGINLPRTKKKRERAFDKQTRICDICGATYNNFKSFQIHMQLHSDESIECPECQESFVSEIQLKRHLKNHQVKVEVINKEKLICTICGKHFTSSGNFSTHMKRHLENYNVTCNECGKGFYRKTDLVSHLRVHTREKPFQCKLCNKKFTEKYTLNNHSKKFHLGDTPYQCDSCSKKFVLKSELMRHLKNSKTCMKIRAGLPTKKPAVYRYQCSYCGNKFRQKQDFVKHQKNYRPCATLHCSNKQCIVVDGTEQITNSDIEMVEEI